jgi:hypothetical protein
MEDDLKKKWKQEDSLNYLKMEYKLFIYIYNVYLLKLECYKT